jgi:hypothetical protein
MNKIIPILPCQSIKDQVAFYEYLGFKTIQVTNRPYAYAVMRYGTLDLNFYGSKGTLPNENQNMCYVVVEDVDRIYDEFTSGLKNNIGKIPRSGIPRISKVKDLASDRRFTLTDVGGNTLYVGTPNAKGSDPAFYRTIDNVDYARNFELLYDLMYSKEDVHSAFNMLEKFFPEDLVSINVTALDLAKILLVALDILLQRNKIANQTIIDRLNELFNDCEKQNPDWKKIMQKYHDIMDGE